MLLMAALCEECWFLNVQVICFPYLLAGSVRRKKSRSGRTVCDEFEPRTMAQSGVSGGIWNCRDAPRKAGILPSQEEDLPPVQQVRERWSNCTKAVSISEQKHMCFSHLSQLWNVWIAFTSEAFVTQINRQSVSLSAISTPNFTPDMSGSWILLADLSAAWCTLRVNICQCMEWQGCGIPNKFNVKQS